MDDQPGHDLARLDAAREDDEPDDDPRDGSHAGFVDVLVNHVQLRAESFERGKGSF